MNFFKKKKIPSLPSNQLLQSQNSVIHNEPKLVPYSDYKHKQLRLWITEEQNGGFEADFSNLQLMILLDIRGLLYQLVDKKKETDNRINTIEVRIDKLSEELKERIILFDDEDKK